jgi:integrase
MHDKSMTKSGLAPQKKGGPVLKVKHGSAVVPIYRGKVRNWTRYTVTFHLNGRRIRRTFGTLEKAREEAQLIARKIQEGQSYMNDLHPLQREALLASERLVSPFNLPVVTAVDEYARCRQMLGDVPLMSAVTDFLRRTKGVQLGSKVPEVMKEFLAAKAQDKMSPHYQKQLFFALRKFSAEFDGEILSIQSSDIDRWLRKLYSKPVTRNSVLRCIKVFFSFAKSRSYLPPSEATAAELVPMTKTGDTETGIFTPTDIQRLLNAATTDVAALVAIGAFAGLRAAELRRLDWSAIDLERRIITLRANQAKTASRRIIPISDNLAQWLAKFPRKGLVVPTSKVPVEATALAKKLRISWPHNGLRHSYISYRIAKVKDAAKVALEAGNSPDIIFKHYRELVTEEAAETWFSICPSPEWTPVPSPPRRAPRKRRRP